MFMKCSYEYANSLSSGQTKGEDNGARNIRLE
jgi:hypothetical protein